MNDTRSTEIKKVLRKFYPNATFKVRIHKYSMGEAIYVSTNAFKIDQVPDPRGYGYVMQASEQDTTTRNHIKKVLSDYESVDRDQWGEIMSGGNTFLFVEDMA